MTRIIVGVVLAVLAAVVVAALTSTESDLTRVDVGSGGVTIPGILQAAGLLFFAFAGYARIATLGEEVRDPSTTIPRAISIALAITVVVYTTVAVAALAVLGPAALATTIDPLAQAVIAAGVGWLAPVVRIGAAVAALGSLLALILGVSRTTLAMARDRHLPHLLAAVHPRFAVPHRAELAIGAVVAVLAATVDIRGSDRFLVLRGADLLRDRQCLGLDPDSSRGTAGALGARPGPARLCRARLLAPTPLRDQRSSRADARSGRLLPASQVRSKPTLTPPPAGRLTTVRRTSCRARGGPCEGCRRRDRGLGRCLGRGCGPAHRVARPRRAAWIAPAAGFR